MTSTEGVGEVSVLFAGLPHTGKTTYLALCYLAISDGRAAGLELRNFRDDREYVNRIAADLQACSDARHTEVSAQGELSLSLTVGDGAPAALVVPDLSGEAWEEALDDRAWRESLDRAAHVASGIVLFAHATEFDDDPSIASVQAAEQALGEVPDTNARHGSTSEEDAPSAQQVGTPAPEASGSSIGAASRSPAQVHLVDLLQLLCEERGPRPARVALVISAWDLAGAVAPDEWVAMNAPLVAQYLEANSDWLNSSVWGVSAQGGSFKKPAQKEALAERDAVDRAFVIDGAGGGHPVVSPLAWAMGVINE